MSGEASPGESTLPSVAVALPLLGLFLLMPPFITLFADGQGVAGVPLIVVYVFGVWCALIGAAVWLARRLRTLAPDEAQAPEAPPPVS